FCSMTEELKASNVLLIYCVKYRLDISRFDILMATSLDRLGDGWDVRSPNCIPIDASFARTRILKAKCFLKTVQSTIRVGRGCCGAKPGSNEGIEEIGNFATTSNLH